MNNENIAVEVLQEFHEIKFPFNIFRNRIIVRY